MGLFDRFRKDSVKDPFGGDDDFYEEESRFAGKGPKIALAGSGVVFASVVGFIGYVLLTSDADVAAPPPIAGSFADLEIEDEAAPVATAPVVQDATAATDRSAERRPWLTSPPPAPAAAKPEAAKPAATAAAKPAAATPPAITPPTSTAAVTPPAITPPTSTAAVTPPASTAKPVAPPAAAKPAAPQTQVAAIPPAATPAAPVGAKPEAAKPDTAKPDTAKPGAAIPEEPASDEPPTLIAGIPGLNAPGVAPGAPERYAATGDAGPAVAGGRPRLVDPPLPPTDRVAVSAPPPRFAALRDVKKEAAAVPPAASAAKVAIVVRGLGLSQAATEAAITKLPPAVTLAFSPYARNIKMWVDRAKAQGHEVLVEVPLESKDFPAQDPGPLGLLTTLELKDNTERLDAIIKASAGAIGVFDAMGSKFRESAPHITPMFIKLKEQNLFYVQGSPGARMGEAGVPTAVADVVLDERPFRAAIDARLDYAERLARYQGSVVASLNAKPVSYERLVLWLEQAQKKGITLTPISAVLIRGEGGGAPGAPGPATTTAKAGESDAPATAKAKPGAEPAGAKAKPGAEPAAAKAKAKAKT